ncbi:hypothetical protein U1Q18_038458 [Sarracenia purpurea var. burkii]
MEPRDVVTPVTVPTDVVIPARGRVTVRAATHVHRGSNTPSTRGFVEPTPVLTPVLVPATARASSSAPTSTSTPASECRVHP